MSSRCFAHAPGIVVMANEGAVCLIVCNCGLQLFIYYKDKKGPLIKCYVDAIIENTGEVLDMQLNQTPHCPACQKMLGRIQLVHNRAALVVDPETVKLVPFDKYFTRQKL